MLLEIDRQIAGLHHLRFGRFLAASPPKNGSEPGGELAELERLRDIIVSSGFQCSDFVILEIPNGDHDDAGVGRDPSDPPTGVNAVNAWHIDIEQNQIEGTTLHGSESFFAVTSFFDCESARGQ
jgi:hypothetical protein